MGREGKRKRGDLCSSSDAEYHQDRKANGKGGDRSDRNSKPGCAAVVFGKRFVIFFWGGGGPQGEEA